MFHVRNVENDRKTEAWPGGHLIAASQWKLVSDEDFSAKNGRNDGNTCNNMAK